MRWYWYALLPILRNTFVGIMSVDAAVRESAVAMGMTSGQMLRQVQLPLAAPTILAGIPGSDGHHHWDGNHRGGDWRRRAGSVHFPRRGVCRYGADSRRRGPGRVDCAGRGWGIGMGGTKIIAGVALGLAFLLAGCSGSHAGGALRVGSKNFTEQVVLGEIIAQHLEHRLHQKVERKLNLGGTLLAHQALLAGEIDLYPEYTGTALVAVLKEPIQTDPGAVLGLVRAEYSRRFHVAWLDSLGINNGFAILVVSGDNKKLETLSNAARSPKPWALGVGYEFEQARRWAEGFCSKLMHAALEGDIKTMDLGLLYQGA